MYDYVPRNACFIAMSVLGSHRSITARFPPGSCQVPASVRRLMEAVEWHVPPLCHICEQAEFAGSGESPPLPSPDRIFTPYPRTEGDGGSRGCRRRRVTPDAPAGRQRQKPSSDGDCRRAILSAIEP